ncbi:MAG: kynureninase, partial [Fimbriimonadaceae bacterium]|nr:kynureninase [Alphaproteobacteria bacterium]
DRITKAVEQEWGAGLISSWVDAGWIDLPNRAGDLLAPLIGAGKGEIIFGDSTSVCLFKLASALLLKSGNRTKVITERENFPTDIYILEGLIRMLGGKHELILVESDQIENMINDRTALIVLTQVNYRTGALLNMRDLTVRARQHGAPIIWDLCHSAGALPVDLNGDGADYAIGCSYKYLNGGPGSPAFTYISKTAIGSFDPLLTGWHGHARPFEFEASYEPAASINKAMIGTPPVLSMIGALTGLATFDGVDMITLRKKSLGLTNLFISLVRERLPAHGFAIASPLDDARRGSQVSLVHPDGYAIMQYLISCGFIGDYREPGILRFGFAPLYVRYIDVWNCVDCLVGAMESVAWDKPEFTVRKAVT